MEIEIRNDSVLIKGYVNAVERDSRKISNQKGEVFVEQVRSGVWDDAIKKNDDIAVLMNHDWNKKVGSTNDNLTLKEDSIGLYAECRSNDADLIEKANNKQLVGWSFGFKANKQSWGKTDADVERRYLDDIDLLEVSILDNTQTPAYYGTSLESRDNEDVIIEQRFIRDTVEYIGIQGKNEEEMRKDFEKKLKMLELELEI